MIRLPHMVALLLLLTAGCDSRESTVLKKVEHLPEVHFETIAQLAPNRSTHVAVDRTGSLYWVQETDNGQDVMFSLELHGLPRATSLSSARILTLLGSAQPQSSTRHKSTTSSGAIQSLIFATDGKVYFYFSGETNGLQRAAFGSFDPVDGLTRILANTQQLENATGMGQSLSLARGRLLATGRIIRLFIRHSDRWVLLDFDPDKRVDSGSESAGLSRSIVNISCKLKSGQEKSIDLTREQTALYLGPADRSSSSDAPQLLLVDGGLGAMYLVDEQGTAKLFASLVLLPKSLSEPVIQDAPANSSESTRVIFFAGTGELIDPLDPERPMPPPIQATYPALMSVAVNDGTYRIISREGFRASGDFPIYSLQVQQLVPFGKHVFVGYDRISGQLLKLELSED